MKCYVEDCDLGEGFYHTSGGTFLPAVYLGCITKSQYPIIVSLIDTAVTMSYQTGPKCKACVAGETWNGFTDDQPCVDVQATCPVGAGYLISTQPSADSTCAMCSKGQLSDATDNEPCVDHVVTSCPAGEELTPGSTTHDGNCAPCPLGTMSYKSVGMRVCARKFHDYTTPVHIQSWTVGPN